MKLWLYLALLVFSFPLNASQRLTQGDSYTNEGSPSFNKSTKPKSLKDYQKAWEAQGFDFSPRPKVAKGSEEQRQQQNREFFQDIPLDIIKHIFLYLGEQEHIKLQQTCKFFKHVGREIARSHLRHKPPFEALPDEATFNQIASQLTVGELRAFVKHAGDPGYFKWEQNANPAASSFFITELFLSWTSANLMPLIGKLTFLKKLSLGQINWEPCRPGTLRYGSEQKLINKGEQYWDFDTGKHLVASTQRNIKVLREIPDSYKPGRISSLSYIRNMKNLEYLSIGSAEGVQSSLTDMELLYIVNANLKKLKTLEFCALPNIKDEGLINLTALALYKPPTVDSKQLVYVFNYKRASSDAEVESVVIPCSHMENPLSLTAADIPKIKLKAKELIRKQNSSNSNYQIEDIKLAMIVKEDQSVYKNTNHNTASREKMIDAMRYTYTDKGLMEISGLELVRLNWMPSITSKGIDALASMSGIKRITVDGCTNIPSSMQASLSAQYPRILFDIK